MRHIPNALCFLRMLLVLPVAWLLVTDNYRLTLAMFAFAAATDGLDGYLAKRFGWTSELGKIIDPLADKILLVALGLVPLWLAVAAVGRDVIITVGAITYKSLYGYGELQGRPTAVSKLNTLCQILYLLLVVAARAYDFTPQIAITLLGALVFVTTVVSGLDYVITYSRRAIEVSRRRRGLA
jgi:cardiolipin synthase